MYLYSLPEWIPEPDASVNQGRYTYKPLDQGRRQIRLIQLTSELRAASNGETVPLLLMHDAFLDGEVVPRYAALSYTWGTGPKATVLVADAITPALEVSISTNLLDALCHFARFISPKQGVILWIDQLCINQDDRLEKSHQVRMMTDIFARAEETNVWLGSRAGAPSHEGMKKYIQHYHHAVEGITNMDKIISELRSDDSAVSQRLDQILSELCRNDFEALYTLGWFCMHPWFERAWVIQEVALATSTKVAAHWESGSCTWPDIIKVSDLLKWLSSRSHKVKGSDTAGVAYLLHTAQTRLEMTTTQSRAPPRTQSLMNLIHDVLWFSRTKATRPEDLVYSLMGMASDGDTCGIEVDYDKHYTEVFGNVALLYMKTIGARTLAVSGQRNRNRDPDGCRLPSWVPDLRLSMPSMIYTTDPAAPKVFSAAGNRSFEYTVGEKSEILSVRTSFVDRVIEVSKSFEWANTEWDAACVPGLQCQAWLTDFANFVDAAADRHSTRYNDSTRQEMVWRSPIADRFSDEHGFRRAGPGVKDLYIATLRPDGPPSVSRANYAFVYQNSMFLEDQVAFVTETGYIGIGHPDIVEGNELHLVQGSDTPFILRMTDDHHQLVGETYVHGIMDGELVDDNTEFEWLEIH